MSKRVISTLVAACALAGLAACSASETDFKKAAEDAIAKAGEDEGVEITDITCDEPSSTDIGTVFDCAFTVDGTALTAPAEITADDTVTVDLEATAPAEG